jgi:2'-5' RNA ligase
MYRYVYGDDRETLVGIQETLRENFSDGIIIPEQLPHYTILGLGEIVNKIKRCNNPDLNLHPSSVRQIYDNISSVIDPGETSVLTYDGVGQTSGSIYLSLLGVDCPAINERAKALKQLSTFTTLGCKFIPHITIGYIRDGN